MKIKKLVGFLAATTLACAVVVTPALAGQMTWNFFTLTGSPAQPGQDLNSTYQVFNQGTQQLLAMSVTSAGCNAEAWCGGTADLYSKNGGTASEQGLGLTGDPYSTGEIYSPNGIFFVSQTAGVQITGFQIGSVQSGETWAVDGWNGSAWSMIGSGTGGLTATFNPLNPASYSAYIVYDPNAPAPGANSNDIIAMSITTSTVPEPGTLALLAAGLAAVGFAVQRRRKAKV